jgi:thioesterase domain-containing protein
VRHHLNQFVQLSPKEKWSYLLERSKRRIQKISRKLSPDLGRPVHHALGGTGYVPQPYPGRITLFHASGRSAELHYDSYMGWGGLAAGGIEVYAIPGTHIDAYKEPNVRIWAEQMKACLDKAQAPARKP